MTNARDATDAQAALTEIRRRQDQAVDAALPPTWYWWAIGAASVGLGFVVDTRQAVAIAVSAIVYAIGVAILTVWAILGGPRRVKASQLLLGPEGAGWIVAFVGGLVVGTIGLAFLLQAIGIEFQATIATLACAIGLVVGGPLLMRRLGRLMKARADAG
jgi:hypothetical protein